MPLLDILQAIEQEADEEVARIEAEAEREAEAIMARARVEAERAADEAHRSREPELRAATDRMRRLARAAAARLLRQAREDAYQRVLLVARARLESVRDRPCYASSLRALLQEALEALPDTTVVRVDPRDEDAVTQLVRLPETVRLAPEIRTWGGVEVATEDRRVIRNTLEERLDRADPYLRPVAVGAMRETIPPETRRAVGGARA